MDRACSECRYNMLPWDYVGEVCKMCRDIDRQRAEARRGGCKGCPFGKPWMNIGKYCGTCLVDRAVEEAAKPKKKKGWWSW